MSNLTSLMGDKELEEFEATRDIEAEILQGVDEMLASTSDTTEYLLASKHNTERLKKSSAQIEAGKIVAHELIEDID
ncbi:hypothetical protein [Acinetobacter puyangensis]|uniref:hypothetical protein n=1 Tax=Acinetobacter puyangensis TaxID=1096779 RepID=UPI003A4E2BA6